MEIAKILWEGYLRYDASSAPSVTWYEFAASTMSLMESSDRRRMETGTKEQSDRMDDVLLAEIKLAALYAHGVYKTTLLEVTDVVGVLEEDCLVSVLQSKPKR